MTVFTSALATHVGNVRQDNEDAAYLGRRVWAVADGMGGHAAGEVASSLAVEAMATLDEREGPLDRSSVTEAVERANEAILAHGAGDRLSVGLGTTLTGVALVTDRGVQRLAVFNVGDSRVYRLAGGQLARVTVDHSEVEELVAEGLITAAEARTHPLRNIVTRCLGMSAVPEVDTWLVKPKAGTRLVLCSDGLTGELTDGAIARILAEEPQPQVAADQLVAAALAAGGSDNVTVVVLDVGRPGK